MSSKKNQNKPQKNIKNGNEDYYFGGIKELIIKENGQLKVNEGIEKGTGLESLSPFGDTSSFQAFNY